MTREQTVRSGPHGPDDGTNELEESLVLDPRVLLDPRFLGMLHQELRGRLGAEDARGVLLRTGYFHGLRDARQALGAADRAGTAAREGPLSPLLAMAFRAGAFPSGGGAFEIRGAWPERLEAEAVLGSLGAREAPTCLVSMGYTSGWLSGVWDAEVLAVEERCGACGDESCSFHAREAALWRGLGDSRAQELLDALPFEALASVVDRHLSERPASPEPEMPFDRASPAIHVWGPVLVIPYSGEDTASSLEVVAREPAVRDVSVVVVDLSDAIIDPGFGAVALERTLETIRGWGAEAILAGLSPFSEAVVRDLEPASVLVRKDLGEAIAAAFQIVESQRHPT